MHIERVRFDLVFDAKPYGEFSFDSGDKTVYDVHLRSNVIPRDGATFEIAFATPGDWTSVVAWRDLASNGIALRETPWEAITSRVANLSTLGIALVGVGCILCRYVGVLGVLAVPACLGVVQAVSTARGNRKARQALLGQESSTRLDVRVMA